MLNIIGRRHIFLGISAAAVVAAGVMISLFGFHEGIDFRGGTLWRFSIMENTPAATVLEAYFRDELKIADPRIAFDPASGSFLGKLPALEERDHQSHAVKLRGAFPGFTEISFQSIGPSVGAELRRNAYIAIALVLIGISLYIAFAFRKVYRPVSSWVYGVITLITLFHDVLIPAGLFAFLGASGRVEVDSNFIVALLVIMGFSVHDTIVVFDRIRENLLTSRGKLEFAAIVNESVNQTLARSVNTSFTLIVVLIALYITGPVQLQYFILTLLVGVTTGIYSSIFVASPLLIVWQRARKIGE
jgi:preprotein translocase subunit SecF